MITIILDEFTKVIRIFGGMWLLREYCTGSGISQEGGCRCENHSWYQEEEISLRGLRKLGIVAEDVVEAKDDEGFLDLRRA